MVRFGAGDRIGNYRVEAELGSSSAGVAYAATHLVLPRCAVVKVATSHTHAVVLMREACLLEALSSHPGVPRVYDSGLLPDRRPWFAIERLADDSLDTCAALSIERALDVLRELAAILEHAHRRGVIHRGLRPDRIAISDDRVCVVDWSDARTHDAGARIPSLPAPGARAYLAPEQQHGEVDDRADIYALGVIAKQLVAERHDGLGDLFDQMTAADRYDRPSATEVKIRLVELIASAATATIPSLPVLGRMRKPRWTPALGAPVITASAASSSRSTSR